MKKYVWLYLVCFAVNGFSLGLADYQYLFPKPGSHYVDPTVQILIRLQKGDAKTVHDLQNFIRLTDASGTTIPGKSKLASDNRTIIFTPQQNLPLAATLYVHLNANSTVPCDPAIYRFTTMSAPSHRPEKNSTLALSKTMVDEDDETTLLRPHIMPNGVSVPGDFPRMHVYLNENPSTDYIFAAIPKGGNKYFTILANDGSPVWYAAFRSVSLQNFELQPNGLITMIEDFRSDGFAFVGMNKNYEIVETYDVPRGYSLDSHDIFVCPNGNYLLIGSTSIPVDMSKLVSDGNPNAYVICNIVFEFTAEHELIFAWRDIDHYNILDKLNTFEFNWTDATFNFSHMNGVAVDDDENILISSRDLSEITKVNRASGEIIWRLSGNNNQFTFVNDPLQGVSMQHDIRALGNNHYTIFDNGSLHVQPTARFVEYALDTEAMTATLVNEFRNEENLVSAIMGSAQRVSNGHTFINWAHGQTLDRMVTEVDADMHKVFEFSFENRTMFYRVTRWPWQGKSKTPVLSIEPLISGIVLLFNKFGDADVDYYKIYADTLEHPTQLIATSDQTLYYLNNLHSNTKYYFRVSAVLNNGHETDFSNEENTIFRTVRPHHNFIQNGDFSDGSSSPWEIYPVNDNLVDVSVIDGVCCIDLKSSSGQLYDSRFYQEGYPIASGRTYRFEFDAHADNQMLITPRIESLSAYDVTIMDMGSVAVTRLPQHFVQDFVIRFGSIADATITFRPRNQGKLYLDNISLKIIDDIEEDESEYMQVEKPETETVRVFSLYANYPNPFNAGTVISYNLLVPGKVELKIYNVMGELVTTLVHAEKPAGLQHVYWDADACASGIYFCRMRVQPQNGSPAITKNQKMMLIH